MSGSVGFLIFFLTYAIVYGILAIGLNIQWGFTGLVNFGVAGFFAVGAYVAAFITGAPSQYHLGGFGLPFPVGLLVATVVSGIFALILGFPVIRLREDYLAIVTIGFAEIVRLVIVTERHITKGPYGMGVIKPYDDMVPASFYGLFYLGIAIAVLLVLYLAMERAVRSPWGRALRTIREDERVAVAFGKNVNSFKLQVLVLGSMIFGLAGAVFGHFFNFITPDHFLPMETFLVWVMVMAGGSGNNLGVLFGALAIRGLWEGMMFLSDVLPTGIQIGAVRLAVIGLLLVLVVMVKPEGVLGEKKTASDILGE
ncbi:MAG: branched-chain amino acid ABC transporter permease [Candidatus Acetothermia bacterium]